MLRYVRRVALALVRLKREGRPANWVCLIKCQRKYGWDMRSLGNTICAAHPMVVFGMDGKKGPRCSGDGTFPRKQNANSPVVEAGIDWHAVVDSRGYVICGRGEDRAGSQRITASILSAVPYSGESERLAAHHEIITDWAGQNVRERQKTKTPKTQVGAVGLL